MAPTNIQPTTKSTLAIGKTTIRMALANRIIMGLDSIMDIGKKVRNMGKVL